MFRRFFGLILFFFPELGLFVIWLLFRGSLIDLRTATMSPSHEIAAFRLVIASAVLLALIQLFRVLPLQAKFAGRGSGRFDVAGVLVIALLVMGIVSELPSIDGMMRESYLSIVQLYGLMLGMVYLSVNLTVLLLLMIFGMEIGKP